MSENKLTFGQSMERLERIVNELSNPNVELEKAMELFREGLDLSRSCQKQLEHFENQMNELIQEDGGGSDADY